ncbi:MAG: DUF3710 domain-containing protein [Actinomycetes bacterium]
MARSRRDSRNRRGNRRPRRAPGTHAGGVGRHTEHEGLEDADNVTEAEDLPEGEDATPKHQHERMDEPSGPYDVAGFEDDGLPRVDLGGLRVPVLSGTEVRVDVQNDQVVAANIVLGDSALQLQAFAAPRSSGIWEEVRAEIVAGISQSGGTADEQLGAFGVELRAQVPVRRQDGRSALQPARFVGHDGPRWFLRGVVTGSALSEPGNLAVLERAFRAVVVVRGENPKPPREPLDLRLPVEPEEGEHAEGAEEHSLDPFTRGPEITETR